jgi:hypothetical protein
VNLRRLFLYLLTASFGLSALVGIAVLLFGGFGLIEVRVLMTTLTVTVTSVFGLACGASLSAARGRYVRIAGIVLSIAAALLCFLIVWNVLDDSRTFVKAFLTTTVLATACAYLSLLSLARLDRRFSWTRTAAVICIALLCGLLIYILWFEPHGESDLVYRALGILGIVLASITVVTPILHKLSSAGDNIEAIDREIADLEARLRRLRHTRDAAVQTGTERP